jgi:type II secretory pathway component PulJ
LFDIVCALEPVMRRFTETLKRVRDSRLAERLRDERGFTLIELLSAEIIGGFVVTAAISMLIIGFKASARVTDRVNSAAQGRIAMEEIQQRLRSQTCLYYGEFKLNAATQPTSSSISFVHAGPSKLVFFTDIGNTNGNTAATTAVGFKPQLRYIYFNAGPTTGQGAYRRGTFVDGVRTVAGTAMPWTLSVTPRTTLAELSYVTGISGVPPTTMRPFAEGITNLVSGSISEPFFRFYDANGIEVTSTTDGYVPGANLGNIDQVEINYQILGLSGYDSKNGVTGTVDNRTAAFSNDVYFKTLQTSCE